MIHAGATGAGRSPGRGRLGNALVCVAAIVLLVASLGFLWGRIALPSEPARISSDAWPWTGAGVEVVPIGDSGTFESGDVVIAIGGGSVEDLVRGVLSPGVVEPLPATLRVDVLRRGAPEPLAAAMEPQPVGALIANGLPLLGYALVQLLVAVLAWMRKPHEGWRRGFLLGASADLASALIWELGLRPSDLVRPEPMLPLFLLSVPLQVLFWSSVVHVLVSWPRRWEAVAGRRSLIGAVYLGPQIALAAGIVASRSVEPSAVAWIGAWDRILAFVVLVLIGLVLVALGRAYLRTGARRDTWLRIVAGACLAVALAVGGLTVLPTLLFGSPVFGRSAVATVGLPLAVVLIVGTLRSRLFEVDVLLASRRRLVVAREEERRRIRRDLHDGIGPMLAAMTLKVDLARDVLRDDPDAADRALDGLKRDTQAAVAEIRRLTRELRPPALDELGVIEAIRQRAVELGGGSAEERVAIDVTTAGSIPPLEAAVEAAAYRIAVEAMTNVVRHAHARRCRVNVSGNGVLVLEVADDGVGFAAGRGAGVGMTSMRERCAELGGSLAVERTPDGWTVVRATLPVVG